MQRLRCAAVLLLAAGCLAWSCDPADPPRPGRIDAICLLTEEAVGRTCEELCSEHDFLNNDCRPCSDGTPLWAYWQKEPGECQPDEHTGKIDERCCEPETEAKRVEAECDAPVLEAPGYTTFACCCGHIPP